MSYAQPEVLVDTEWVSKNPPGNNRKFVEVDYDPENGYRKGHIKGSSLIWWKRDINDPITRDIINKKQFEELMGKNGITADTEVVLYGDFNNWFAAFVFWVFKYYGHENLKIMNGGRKKWELENREYTTEEPNISNTQYAAGPPDGAFKTVLELKQNYLSKGVTPDKDVICYCRIGERSSHSWFVLKYLLGYPKVRNYDGSWTEWGNMIGNPVEK